MSSVISARNAMYADEAKTDDTDTDGGRGWTQAINYRMASLACGGYERELARVRHEHRAARDLLEEREAQAEAAAGELARVRHEHRAARELLEEREAQAEAAAAHSSKLGTEVSKLGAEVSRLTSELAAEKRQSGAEVSRLTAELAAEKRQTTHLSSILLSDTIAEQRLLEQARQSDDQLEQLQLEVSRLSALLDQEMAGKAEVSQKLEKQETENCDLREQLNREKDELSRVRMDLKYRSKLLDEKGGEFDDLAQQLAQKMVEVDSGKVQLAKASEEVLRKDADAIDLQGQLECAQQQHERELEVLKTSLAEKEHEVATLGDELAEKRAHADGLAVQVDDLREQLVQALSEVKVWADKESMRAEDLAGQLLRARDALSQAHADLDQKALFAEDVSQQVDRLAKASEHQNQVNKHLAQERWSWELTSQLLVSQLKESTDALGECRRECCQLSDSLQDKEAEIKSASQKLVEADEQSEALKSSLKQLRHENLALEQRSAEFATLQQVFLQKTTDAEDLADQLRASEEQLMKMRSECCKLRDDLGTKEVEIQDVSQKLAEADVAVDNLKSSLEQLTENNSALSNESEVATARLMHELSLKAMGNEDLAGQLLLSTQQLRDCRRECSKLSDALEGKEAEIQAASKELAEAGTDVQTLYTSLEKQREENRQLAIESSDESARLQHELAQKTMRSEDLEGQLQGFAEQLVVCRRECCEFRNDLLSKEAEIQSASTKLRESEVGAEALKSCLEQLREENTAFATAGVEATARLQTELAQKTVCIEDLTCQLACSSDKLLQCRRDCCNLSNLLESREAEIQEVLAEKSAESTRLLEELAQASMRSEDVTAQLQVSAEQLLGCRRECCELKGVLEVRQTEIHAASQKLVEADVDAEALRTCVEHLRHENTALASEAAAESARLLQELGQRAMGSEDLAGQLRISTTQVAKLRHELHALHDRHSACVNEVDSLTQSLSKTQLEKGALTSENSRMTCEVNEVQVRNRDLSEELSKLKLAVHEEHIRNDELVQTTLSLTQRLEHETKKKEEAAQRCAELICSCPRLNLEAWIGKVRAFHDSTDWQLVTWSGTQEKVVLSTLQSEADSEQRSDETPCIILNVSRNASKDNKDDHISVKVCTPPGRTALATKSKRGPGRLALRDKREPIIYDRIMNVLQSNAVVYESQGPAPGRIRTAHTSSYGSAGTWRPP